MNGEFDLDFSKQDVSDMKHFKLTKKKMIELENKLGEYNYKSIKEAVGKTEEY